MAAQGPGGAAGPTQAAITQTATQVTQAATRTTNFFASSSSTSSSGGTLYTTLPSGYTLPTAITNFAPELKRYTGPFNLINPVPDGEARISLYGYWPGSLLCYVAFGAFGFALLLSLIWFLRFRKTRIFELLLILGCGMELAGYVLRYMNTSNPFVVNPFVVQYFLIVTAPVPFAAALYLSLSIAVRTLKLPQILPMSPRKVVGLFVFVDVATTITQCVGAGLIGIAESQKAKQQNPIIPVETANALLLAGLAVQCAGFLAFMVVTLIALFRNELMRHRRLRPKSAIPYEQKDSTEGLIGDDRPPAELLPPVRRVPVRFWLVLICSALAIWTRTLFRLGETSEGVFGPASSSETLFASLEFAPVAFGVLLWAIFPLEWLLRERV